MQRQPCFGFQLFGQHCITVARARQHCVALKMQKSERLSVRWDDFQQNVRASFKELREDREFADVTLVCQDGKQFEVHKNILAASSPFFLDIFRTKKHPHPLVYLSGMKSQILVSVVDFIYYGEASIHQEDMEDFLAVADELALKGLANKKETFKKNLPTSHIEGIEEPKSDRGGTEQKKDNNGKKTASVSAKIAANGGDLMFKCVETDDLEDGSLEFEDGPESMDPISTPSEPGELENLFENGVDLQESAKDETVYTNIQEMNKQVKSLYSKSDMYSGPRASKCNVCGKLGQRSVIRDHVEAHHVKAIRRNCDLCGKSFKTRNSLKSHKSLQH